MNLVSFPWLTALIVFPLLASFAIPFIPDKEGKNVRWYSLSVGLIHFASTIYVFWAHYDYTSSQFQLQEVYSWIPQIGLTWSVGVDGLSMPLILLSSFISTLALIASWRIEKKPKLYFALMLILYGAQIGVFASGDLLLFFLMWELELIPVYILISVWGGKKRLYAATKFILYTALASIFILIAGLVLAFYGDKVTFNLAELKLKSYPEIVEMLAYAAFLIAFAVKLPIFPLHTWLPDAHSEASAPVSMILAGVLLKMGGYGLIRMNVDLLPHAHIKFAPVLVVLGVINIVYGAFTAFAQTNLKRRLASSSISHMGFVLVGIACFSDLGLNGALLQMISHGLIAAALFFLSGVTYERSNTLIMNEMGGMAKSMPKIFALFTAASMASLALPGMSGFASELSVFLGLTSSHAYTSSFKLVVVIIASVGLILTPIYLLSMLRVVFYGQTVSTSDKDKLILSDAKPREIFVSVSLLLPIIAIGLYPKLATGIYDASTLQISSKLRSALPLIANQGKEDLWSAVSLAAPEIISKTNS